MVGATALVVLASAVTVTASSATASDGPSAPYTAFTVHQEGWGPIIDGSYSYEPSRTTLIVTRPAPSGHSIHFYGLYAAGIVGLHEISASPPTGSQFVAGTTYPVAISHVPSATQTTMFLTGRTTCGIGGRPGSLNVLEATYDGAGVLSTFAATYTLECFGGPRVARGELRYQSGLDFRATDDVNGHLLFGRQPVGLTGATMDATVVVHGTLPTTFGAASIDGVNPSAFTISSNSCSGNTLGYGETCTVRVTAHATALGTQVADLRLEENSFAGRIVRRLGLDGFDPRDAEATPATLDFGDVPAYETAARTVTLTSTSVLPITFGPAAITGAGADTFTTSADTCSGATLDPQQTCTVTVTAHPTSLALTSAVLVLPDDSLAGSTSIWIGVNGFNSDRGTYYPLAPSRLLDTRIGFGAPQAKIGPGGVLSLPVTGRNGVPPSMVAAVVLNVTVTGPTAGSYLTVYPTGVARPRSSSVNFPAGWTGANSVTAAVGDGGRIDIYNNAGSADVIVDISGYYSAGSLPGQSPMGGQYHPVEPIRLVDTRDWGIGRIPADSYIDAPAWFESDNPHIKAFAVNITAVSPAGSGYLTAWNGNPFALPTASTLNFTANTVVPNFAVVPAMPCSFECGEFEGWPSIGVYTSRATHILVDLVGFYDDATLPDGLRFASTVPTRITDTRSGLGWPSKLGQQTTAAIAVPGSLAGPDTRVVAMNVTAVQPTVNTYLTVWPTGLPRPTVSNLNPAAGVTVPNAVQTLINTENRFNVYNFAGAVHVLSDVVGTFYVYPGTATSLATAQAYPPEMRRRAGLRTPSSLVRKTR
jgi:hypothetical protein